MLVVCTLNTEHCLWLTSSLDHVFFVFRKNIVFLNLNWKKNLELLWRTTSDRRLSVCRTWLSTIHVACRVVVEQRIFLYHLFRSLLWMSESSESSRDWLAVGGRTKREDRGGRKKIIHERKFARISNWFRDLKTSLRRFADLVVAYSRLNTCQISTVGYDTFLCAVSRCHSCAPIQLECNK